MTTDKIKCRFHPNGKCPKKKPMQSPASLIAGTLTLNDKVYTSRSIIRYARMKNDMPKLNKEWTLWYEKAAIKLIRTNDLGIIVSNFNPKFYSPNEIMSGLQLAIDTCKTNEDTSSFIAKDRGGVG